MQHHVDRPVSTLRDVHVSQGSSSAGLSASPQAYAMTFCPVSPVHAKSDAGWHVVLGSSKSSQLATTAAITIDTTTFFIAGSAFTDVFICYAIA